MNERWWGAIAFLLCERAPYDNWDINILDWLQGWCFILHTFCQTTKQQSKYIILNLENIHIFPVTWKKEKRNRTQGPGPSMWQTHWHFQFATPLILCSLNTFLGILRTCDTFRCRLVIFPTTLLLSTGENVWSPFMLVRMFGYQWELGTSLLTVWPFSPHPLRNSSTSVPLICCLKFMTEIPGPLRYQS